MALLWREKTVLFNEKKLQWVVFLLHQQAKTRLLWQAKINSNRKQILTNGNEDEPSMSETTIIGSSAINENEKMICLDAGNDELANIWMKMNFLTLLFRANFIKAN